MRVHVVHAHPEPSSYVAAMRDVVIEELRAQGALVSLADLYVMQFNPVMSANDFGERQRTDRLDYLREQRHGFRTGTLAPDIRAEVENVLAADLLAFTFPVYWFSVPAIMKGWIERVFLSGPFFSGKRIYGRGGLAGKRAFAAMSLGGRPYMFGPQAVHGELETSMMRHFFQGTLGYVGLSVYRSFAAYHVPHVDHARRCAMLDELRHYLRTLDKQPIFSMPDLSGYDDVFAPRSGIL